MTGPTGEGLEQPKQGQGGVVSDHTHPLLSADGCDVYDQRFTSVTAPGLEPTPGAEGVEARESPLQTTPLEFKPLETNNVPLHSNPSYNRRKDANNDLPKPDAPCW